MKCHASLAAACAIAAMQEVVRGTLAEPGRLDILVDNAGIVRRADAVEFTQEDWDA